MKLYQRYIFRKSECNNSWQYFSKRWRTIYIFEGCEELNWSHAFRVSFEKRNTSRSRLHYIRWYHRWPYLFPSGHDGPTAYKRTHIHAHAHNCVYVRQTLRLFLSFAPTFLTFFLLSCLPVSMQGWTYRLILKSIMCKRIISLTVPRKKNVRQQCQIEFQFKVIYFIINLVSLLFSSFII